MNTTPSKHLTLPRRHLGVSASAIAIAAALGLSSCATAPPDAQAVLRAAEAATGANAVKSIRVAGAGTGATFGQAWQPGAPWPRLNYSSFVRVADYDSAALREEFARSRAEPNGGGAIPLMGLGEQRAVGVLQGEHAWNQVGPAPVASPVALDSRIHDLWTMPHGVLKAARQHNATASRRTVDGRDYLALSFTVPGRFSATAFVNPATNLVDRVESTQPQHVMGDTASVITYADWRDHGGVKVPARMSQNLGGHPVLDVTFTDVQINAPAGIATPDLVKAATERVTSEVLAPGVWFLAGGSHNSVLIEMRDHLILVEAPLYDGRSAAVLAQARSLAPGKPVRYAVNSHHHFDHAGGLRTAAAEGATLVTSAQAKPWYDRIMANPNRIRPDLLARSGRTVSTVGVNGKHSLGDASRAVDVYEIAGSVHAQGFLMVHLPQHKILIQGDAFTPGAPGAPAPAVPNDNNVNLLRNIEQLKLDVERIAPLHGRVVPLRELLTAVGR